MRYGLGPEPDGIGSGVDVLDVFAYKGRTVYCRSGSNDHDILS